MLKRRFSTTASVVVEGQASPATAAGMHDVNEDKDLKGDIGLEEVEHIGAKHRLRSVYDSCRAKKPEVPGIDTEALELSTALINQEASADADQSTELVSMNSAVATAQAHAKKA